MNVDEIINAVAGIASVAIQPGELGANSKNPPESCIVQIAIGG